MQKLKVILSIIRSIPVLPLINWNNEAIRKDLKRWKQVCNIQSKDWIAMAVLLSGRKEFRNLLLYRNSNRFVFKRWIRLFYKPLESLFIETPYIGGGLYIQHGFATMISAKSIGENCWVNQQVTIGYGKGSEPPVIGNNVMITCGAKVLGQITVGDNAIIGANAVVIKDVEPGAVMGGVPAKRIH